MVKLLLEEGRKMTLEEFVLGTERERDLAKRLKKQFPSDHPAQDLLDRIIESCEVSIFLRKRAYSQSV